MIFMKLENTEDIIEINDELSCEFEVAKVLRQYPKDTVILTNVKNSEMPVVSGICNTREKIAKSINCEVNEITSKIIEASDNPIKVENFTDFSEYNTTEADLSKLPILTHYKRDGGAYITSGVVFARDPETGIQNASIHRMMVLDDKRLAIRIVPRNLYTYFQKAQKLNKDLEIAKSKLLELSMMFIDITNRTIENNSQYEVLSSKIDKIQKSLKKIESDIYIDEDEEDDEYDENGDQMHDNELNINYDEDYEFEIKCPYCNYEFVVGQDADLKETIECPKCHKEIELDWDDYCDGECNHCENICYNKELEENNLALKEDEQEYNVNENNNQQKNNENQNTQAQTNPKQSQNENKENQSNQENINNENEDDM